MGIFSKSLNNETNKKEGGDVGWWHDFVFWLQACVSAEHHAQESYGENKQKLFLDIATKVRKARSKLMYKHIKEGKGQRYCLCKHLMQMAQTSKELANRAVEKGDLVEAEELFADSISWESIFILLNQEQKGGSE